MSARRKTERRKEIAALVEEGRVAYLAGRHRQTNPYRYCNMDHWLKGYDIAETEEKTRLCMAVNGSHGKMSR